MANILIADDDDLVGELVRFKLEQGGHDVTVSQDGSAAFDLAKTRDFDLVVLDSMMPVMSGFQILCALRASPRTAELPIVMLTARKSQDDVVAALNAGANDYVTKPFIPEELLIRVNTILKTGGGDAVPAQRA